MPVQKLNHVALNSATGQLDSVLARIKKRETEIHAFSFLAEESARKQAAALDELHEAEKHRRPLFGLTLAIKDVIDVAGMPTTAGSNILKDFLAIEDATSVHRLRKAGAVFVGKTVTTEFAFSDPGPTRNPRKLDHTPGGSSSGSAAAVAAGFCSAALGTQTFGSVIRPAAYCGVIGFKPSYGAIPTAGMIPLAWSFDHIGILGQSVELAARIAEIIIEEKYLDERPCQIFYDDPQERKSQLNRIVIGVPDRYFMEGVDTTVQEGCAAGLQALENIGAKTAIVKLPALFESAVAAAGTILQAEAATFHQKWFPERSAEYRAYLRTALEQGNSISAVEYVQALQLRCQAQRQMKEIWTKVDFLATPSAPTVAPYGLASTGNPRCNIPFSIFGNPVVTMPSGYSPHGLPAGLQLIGAQGSETKLLRLALALERNGFGRVLPLCD